MDDETIHRMNIFSGSSVDGCGEDTNSVVRKFVEKAGGSVV